MNAACPSASPVASRAICSGATSAPRLCTCSRIQPSRRSYSPARTIADDRAELALDGLEELRRVERSERVGREVADQPGRPVHVLQHAHAVVRRNDADERAHALVPGGRQIVDRQVASHQRELELEAQEDVQVVGDLVGLDADQRRLDEVGGAHELLERDVVQLLGERLPDLRAGAAPRMPASGRPCSPRSATATRAGRARWRGRRTCPRCRP